MRMIPRKIVESLHVISDGKLVEVPDSKGLWVWPYQQPPGELRLRSDAVEGKWREVSLPSASCIVRFNVEMVDIHRHIHKDERIE